VSLRRKLAVIALVYVIEGFPMGIWLDLLPVYWRRHEISLTAIGFVNVFSFAWALKVFWSPLIDRFGERRSWIAAANAAMALALLGVAIVDPIASAWLLWACIGVYCVASATQDVAIDAYSIGLAERGEEGPFNSMKATAYRIGMLAAGSGLLLLPNRVGWAGTFTAAALLTVIFALATRVAPSVPVPDESRAATIAPLRRWLAQGGAVPVFVFVLLYRVGDRAMGPMVMPFWVDRGFSDEEIALVRNALGIGATVLGAIVGGVTVARIGIGRSLWWLGAVALASNLGYAAAAAFPELGRAGVYGASIIESFTSGLAGAAFLSYLMRICEKEHAAVQYALLTAVYALSGSLLSLPSGWLTERMGYAAYFALTAAMALPAFAFLPRARAWIGAERLYRSA
jgi:PAT family beta-lactamase induction signal transducer AmpG